MSLPGAFNPWGQFDAPWRRGVEGILDPSQIANYFLNNPQAWPFAEQKSGEQIGSWSTGYNVLETITVTPPDWVETCLVVIIGTIVYIDLSSGSSRTGRITMSHQAAENIDVITLDTGIHAVNARMWNLPNTDFPWTATLEANMSSTDADELWWHLAVLALGLRIT